MWIIQQPLGDGGKLTYVLEPKSSGTKDTLIQVYNRQEKSLRHVAMVAKFLDLNKSKMSVKKWNHTVANLKHVKLSSNLILFNLSNVGKIFQGWIRKDSI